eukprot:1821009-Prymnesium_polylepis.1
MRLLATRGQPASNCPSCSALERSHERHHLWKVLTSTASRPSAWLASLRRHAPSKGRLQLAGGAMLHARGAWFERTPHSRCRISAAAFREKLRHRM